MANIDITKSFADGEILLESDLDNIIDDVETFLNVTGISDDNIQSGGITASTKIATGSVSTANLAASAVTTAKINDLAVTTAKIDASAVTTAKILDANVTTAKIADSNVTTAKIADSNVTTAKIADSNVTTAKIADGAVTGPKLASAVYGSGNASTTINTTPTATVSITSQGRPCLCLLHNQSGAVSASITNGSGGVRNLYISVDGVANTLVHTIQNGAVVGGGSISVVGAAIISLSAGSRTVGLVVDSSSVSSLDLKLTVMEL